MNSFNSQSTLSVGDKTYNFFKLGALEGVGELNKLPFSIRILLENLLRSEDGTSVTKEDVEAVAKWDAQAKPSKEIAFRPSRVLLQDFTGVPAVVDLAAMRDAITKMGGDPQKVNPLQTVDLVIDHSVQVDTFGSADAFQENANKEFERNQERYQFLRWGQQAFDNFRVVPPDTGIVHQVNLEYLAPVVFQKEIEGKSFIYPDSLVGTDSHTTMINGLGVLGWGVGGIEAEAAMLGQPISMLLPQVIGFKLVGELPEGATATDLVLTVTEMLRKKGVVGKFVEFFGDGLKSLSLADRATIANMAPEYGATMGFMPVDEETLRYMRLTGRDESLVQLTEAYLKEQGLFRTDDTPDPVFTDTLELDLKTIVPSMAGPKRPQDRVALNEAKNAFGKAFADIANGNKADVSLNGDSFEMTDGNVVIAAITSCTNTSNPAVMMGAGLLAKKAVEKGLNVKPWVKTSLAPGSKVVIDYLQKSDLLKYLEDLKFHLVGYGCTTCIGNSGPLPEEVASAVKEQDLVAVSVLSGNRNFEGRINPHVRANYLASPPLVVAYAIAGTMDIDLANDSLGAGSDGKPVFLKDIWPTSQEVEESLSLIQAEMFKGQYENAFDGDKAWQTLEVPTGNTFAWDDASTYVKNPPYFEGMGPDANELVNIEGARALAVLGDSVTTDHISPAGAIPQDSPTAKYLKEKGVEPKDFNSYGARRGNHEIMMRGTFGNIRLRNLLLPGTEGGVTKHFPDGESMSIFEASMKYKQEGVPSIVLAGKEYGTGSSRDWAAKGPALLGVKAVIAESFERIHRSNLVGMGVLPLQFTEGSNRDTIGLSGEEVFSIEGITELAPGKELTCVAEVNGEQKKFSVVCRIDTPVELEYYRHGGILKYVLRQLVKS